MPKILVIGSINMDMVARIDHIPLQGESVIGEGYSFNPGGKGANAAVAAARLGGEVSFAGCVGRDDYGVALRKVLTDEGVDDALLRETNEAPSGYAPILVQKNGRRSSAGSSTSAPAPNDSTYPTSHSSTGNRASTV